MKLIVEGYPYVAQDVERVLQGIDAPQNKDGLVRVNYVGYFYNKHLNDCVFFLPKVVIDEQQRLLGQYTPEELINVERCKRMRREDREFIYGLSVWIYRAIREFQRQNEDSDIVYVNTYSRLDGSSNRVQNTLLDVILSLIRFNNENHNFFMFVMKNIHSGYNKINWTKTISNNQALLQRGRPVYLDPVNKKKQVNFDEELLIIYFSVLNYIKERYGFRTNIDANYELITGNEFHRWLDGYGKLRLRQIKYKYFSDKALALWKHCYAFFDLAQLINSSRQQNDYMLVKNFNIVFEAIIDELLSDKSLANTELKDQPDGKLVDHIYAYDGLINDKERIYYIGDSKYYKLGSKPGETSVYKQYTYARNVIQYNLKLFLRDEKDEHGRGKGAGTEYLIYRDPDTEGYNITPNFFISARLNLDYDYDQADLTFTGDEPPMKHFENRLFDRDTLLLQRYDVNFLFVVALYAGGGDWAKSEFKREAQRKFRGEIIQYLESRYQFFSLQKRPKNTEPLRDVINRHFRDIIGRTFRPYSDDEILYLSCETEEKYREDNMTLLSQLSEDFIIRDYKLGTDPRDTINHFTNVYAAIGQQPAGGGRKFSLQDFADETILIGGYRREKNQLQWILENNKYNVRSNAARSGSVGRIKETAVSARLLVLYDIADSEHGNPPLVFLLSGHRYVMAKTMLKLGYKEPNGNYLLYTIERELPFEEFNLHQIMEYARIEEMQKRIFNKTITNDWELSWTGTPLYYKGREILRILNGEAEPAKITPQQIKQYSSFGASAMMAAESAGQENNIAQESLPQPQASSEVATGDTEQIVAGIWNAFKSLQFRKRFQNRLTAGGMKTNEATMRMNHFYNKVKDADEGGIFRKRLRECNSFTELKAIFDDLFIGWGNTLKYPWVRQMFYDYIDFLRDVYLSKGSLDDTDENNVKKTSKIKLIYADGTEELLLPIDALKKVVLTIGVQKVQAMNLKVKQDKLILNYEPHNNRYYEAIDETHWLLAQKGTPKEKYQIIFIMLQHHSGLGIKVKLIQ